MPLSKLLLYPAVFTLSGLLTGCEPGSKILLYNGTDQAIALRSAVTGQTLTVAAKVVVTATSFLHDGSTISQAGRTYRYSLGGLAIDHAARVEFAADHRLYLLPTGGLLRSSPLPPQPAGFPLSPR